VSFYRSFGIYTVAGFISKGIAFLLLPFFTYYLSQSDYGHITIFSNSMYFIAPLMNMGIGEIITVEYSSLDNKQIASFVSSSFTIPICVLLITLFFAYLFHPFFSNLIGLSEGFLYLICLLSFFNFFSEYFFTILRNQNKPVSFGILAIAKTVFELVLAIYFIKFCGDGYVGRVKSIFLSIFIVSLLSLIYLVKHKLVNFNISKKWLSLILVRGLPTIPLFFMMYFLYNTDTFMVNYYYGSAKAGLYGLAGQLAFVLTVITTSFITPFYPFLYDNLNKRNYVKIVSHILKYTLFISIIILLITLLAPFIFKHFIANKFHEAFYYLFLLLVGQYFYSLYLILVGLIYYKKHNYIYYYFCPIVIILTIFINYFLLNVIKVQQFAWASATSYFICLLMIVLVYFKYIKKGMIIYIRSFTKESKISV